MRSNKKRTRKEFAPLIAACSVSCITPASPETQVYNASLAQWEPDRTLTPSVLYPNVQANATDGSWPDHHVNKLLADMVWKCNGVDISTLSDWTGKYAIETSGHLRGALTVSRNVYPGEALSMTFEAKFADSRTGVNVPVVSEEIPLTTLDSSEDDYRLSIGDDSNMQYNPFDDKLALYEYKVSQGMITPSDALKLAANDHNSYERKIPVSLYQGESAMAGGYTLKLYEVGSTGALTQITTADARILALELGYVTLDLRLIEKADFLLKAFVDNVEKAKIQFGTSRVYPPVRCQPVNSASLHAKATQVYNRALADINGHDVECPELNVMMLWYTDTATATDKVHNEGVETIIQLASTGIGESANDSYLDMSVEYEQKDAHCVATDGSDVYVDENGDNLIFN